MIPDLKNLISDAVADFLYYDRKEDDDFPVGKIEEMVAWGEVTVGEIINEFASELRKGLS